MSDILVVDKKRLGERIMIVRKYGAGLSQRGLGTLLESKDPNLVGTMEKGGALTYERLTKIAEVCAGRGVLKNTAPEEILGFLEGRLEQLNVVLDGSFSQMS
jgi:hypothetical protein